ncbi:hypothetical protein GCM10010211_34950 [Streptomyces albospinus]|uniref:Uncharacterized protein n=1 Tax=Streptomyces albospinus TaxID=285515 RepID=A0ABQ2V354_9ACTN|nr:hypothetical protein GCM10010211_34950 [Streptomyces albospinus]
MERGKTGAVTSPRAQSTLPSAASTTSEPRWRPSTKPERNTSARTGDDTGDTAGTDGTVGTDAADGTEAADGTVGTPDDGSGIGVGEDEVIGCLPGT